jgi:microcystin-dependent protein
MPAHTHIINASATDANTTDPVNHILARDVNNPYRPPADGSLIALNPAMITNVGGSQPHENMMPYLCLNYCIALQGIFPSQN